MNDAKTDVIRVKALIFLENKYAALGEKAKADSCLKLREAIADKSKDWVVKTEHYSWLIQGYLFGATYDSIKEKGYALCRELVNIGQKENIPVARVMGNGYIGWSLARDGKMEQSLGYLANTLAAALESRDDSLIAEAYAFYTNTYTDKNNYLQAYKYQLKALDIAEKMNNNYLLWDYNIWLSNIYGSMGDKEKRIEYRIKLLDFAHKTKDPYDDLAANYFIRQACLLNADLVSAEQYHLRFMHLANSLGLEDKAKQKWENDYIDALMFAKKNDLGPGFQYMEKKPGRWENFLKSRRNMDMYLFRYHRYYKNLDSVAFYLKRAYDLNYSKVNDRRKKGINADMGSFFSETGKLNESIAEWKTAFSLSEKLADPEGQQEAAFEVYDLSKKNGNITDALFYHEKYKAINDSLESINNKNELTLAELINEQKVHDNTKLEEEAKTRRRHQLQYIGITIGVVTFFIFSMMIGFFRVSERTIRLLGFLSFIFVFEFLIMIADKQIHDWTHGEPLYIFLIKIGLIAILLPLHQLIEKKVIHFLVSRKLLRLRDGRFWRLLFGDEDPIAQVEKT